MDKKKIDNLTNQFENLKFKKELDKKIQAMLAIDKLARKEKNLKEDSKKVISPKNLGKKWKSNREKRRLEKEKEKEDRLLRSITKMYGYDGEEEDYTDLGFGKKQKKDIKGMLKKILLYGGLPLLLLVSLGVLSNTKLKGKQRKQNTKVEKDSNEIKFKKKFAKMIEQVIIRKHDEFRKLDPKQKKDIIDTSKRQKRRDVTFEQILTPEKPPPSSVSSVSTVEQKPLTKQQIRQQRRKKLEHRMKINPPSPFDPNTYIKIPRNKESFSYVKKDKANYKITEGDVIEFKTKSGWTRTKHVWNPENEEIIFRSGGPLKNIPKSGGSVKDIIPVFKLKV